MRNLEIKIVVQDSRIVAFSTCNHPVPFKFPVTMKLDEEERNELQIQALDLHNLEVISAVGRGAKGVVFLAIDKASNAQDLLALKVISKSLIEKKTKPIDDVVHGSEYKRILFEQQVLRRFDHPLLPRLRGALDTQNVVAYAIDYCPGGNLNSLRKRQTEKMFSDDVIRYVRALFLDFDVLNL